MQGNLHVRFGAGDEETCPGNGVKRFIPTLRLTGTQLVRVLAKPIDERFCPAYHREAGGKLLQLPSPAIIVVVSLSIAFDIFNQLAHVIVATIFEIRQVRRCEVCNIG